MTARSPRILMISGSLRRHSTNTATLRTTQHVAAPGVSGSLYDEAARLPHFNPDDEDPLPAPVVDLRQRIGDADALLLSTPEYAGDLPGSFKNLLDWTVGGVEICDKPTAWINVSSRGPLGAKETHDSLRRVLAFTGALIVEGACAHIPVEPKDIGDDGLLSDQDLRRRLLRVVTELTSGR